MSRKLSSWTAMNALVVLARRACNAAQGRESMAEVEADFLKLNADLDRILGPIPIEGGDAMACTWVSQPELAEVIGEEATKELLRSLGGQTVYVPKCSDLIASIGSPAIKALCGQFAGMTLALPVQAGSSRKERVIQLLASGMRPAAVAREVGVTERWVRMVKADIQPQHGSEARRK